ncbi:aminoacyl trna synthase [Lynx pardinus]|uniref:Aminoacyl trna synthase n=1 Tax=Lynx pardinus TaxID=191816 RepID=A0A485P609_LYNPA|nr:aminoacyl trna synthase [Lynx pardinus]
MIFCRIFKKMATNGAVLKRLEQKGAEADQIIEYLKQQVALLKEKAILQATLREEKKLRVENAKLKKEIEELKQELIQAELQNGVKQIPFPSGTPLQANSTVSEKVIQSIPMTTVSSGAKEQITGGRAEEKMKEKIEMKEEIDVGETAPRTVVSGLVNHVPLEQMQNRMVILLCNLKPAKMRGVISQAMVMCASSPEKVEILAPPTGSVPGDRIIFDAFPGEPDKELNPKKKIWEQIQPDLSTNDECVATYKGVPFEVKGKGVCRAQTMTNSGIK